MHFVPRMSEAQCISPPAQKTRLRMTKKRQTKRAARKPPQKFHPSTQSIFTLSTCIESPLTEPVAAM
jgi:hypothetical protein